MSNIKTLSDEYNIIMLPKHICFCGSSIFKVINKKNNIYKCSVCGLTYNINKETIKNNIKQIYYNSLPNSFIINKDKLKIMKEYGYVSKHVSILNDMAYLLKKDTNNKGCYLYKLRTNPYQAWQSLRTFIKKEHIIEVFNM